MNNFFSHNFHQNPNQQHAKYENSHQQNFFPSSYPEDMILNVETMTFSKANTHEKSHSGRQSFDNDQQQQKSGQFDGNNHVNGGNFNQNNDGHNQNSFNPFSNMSSLLGSLQNNPLGMLLGGNDALSGLLKNGMLSGQNPLNIQTLAQLFANNKSAAKKQEDKEEIIDIDSSYEEI